MGKFSLPNRIFFKVINRIQKENVKTFGLPSLKKILKSLIFQELKYETHFVNSQNSYLILIGPPNILRNSIPLMVCKDKGDILL